PVQIGTWLRHRARLHPLQLHEQILKDVFSLVSRDLAGTKVAEQGHPVLEEGRLQSSCRRFRVWSDDGCPCRTADLPRRDNLTAAPWRGNANGDPTGRRRAAELARAVPSRRLASRVGRRFATGGVTDS